MLALKSRMRQINKIWVIFACIRWVFIEAYVFPIAYKRTKLTSVGHSGHLRTRRLGLHAKAKKAASSTDKINKGGNKPVQTVSSIAVPNLLKAFKEGTLEKVGSAQAGEEEDHTEEVFDNPYDEKDYTHLTKNVAIMSKADLEDDKKATQVNREYQDTIEGIILSSVERERANDPKDGGESLYVHTMKWVSNRLEVILSSNNDDKYPEGPPMSRIQAVHRSAYSEFELREEELNFASAYELIISSPGVRDELHSDRDYTTFRGFPVVVLTTEEFKKKKELLGTLVGRDEDHVRISIKGRVVKIPRGICLKVALPPAKFESTDYEMRKLR